MHGVLAHEDRSTRVIGEGQRSAGPRGGEVRAVNPIRIVDFIVRAENLEQNVSAQALRLR